MLQEQNGSDSAGRVMPGRMVVHGTKYHGNNGKNPSVSGSGAGEQRRMADRITSHVSCLAMSSRVWFFSSVQHRPTPDSVAHMWQWRVEVGGKTEHSSTFFYTLEDCVRDAQQNGFSGKLSDSPSSSYR